MSKVKIKGHIIDGHLYVNRDDLVAFCHQEGTGRDGVKDYLKLASLLNCLVKAPDKRQRSLK